MANGDMSAREVVNLLAKILIEGRGGGIPAPNDPQFGIGGDALPAARSKKKKAAARSSRSSSLKIKIPKQKRKVSGYQKRFGINLKKLKKKHPRTSISVLMKKAHRITRRDMK